MNDTFTWPVGCGSSPKKVDRNRASLLPVAAYAMACALAGSVTGLVIASVGYVTSQRGPGTIHPLVWVAVGVAAVSVGLELRSRVAPLPQRHAQVPRRWIMWRRPSASAAAFGLLIGSGVFTYLQHATAYALAALLFLSPSPATGALLGGAYDLARGSALVLTWASDQIWRRRLSWHRLSDKDTAVHHALAATAVVCVTASVLLT